MQYMGGKSKFQKQLISLMQPERYETYVEKVFRCSQN